MMKRLYAAAAALFVLSAPAFAAGTIPGISMTQQLDATGKPLNGGKLYFIQAGTTSTPQNCYQDSNLTIALANPITLNAAGRVPQIFCADGQIKIRLTNAAGVDQLVADNLLIVGPSGGGGGGGSVDPTTVLATGDFKDVYNTGTLSGFVRCNGRTIGSASSGASERANADTSALFAFLYAADANLSVSGGRGANAAADYAANKTLTLPDCRGRNRASLDDMGNTAAGRLTTTYYGTSPIVLGAASTGLESRTLFTVNLPPYTPSGSITNTTISVSQNAASTGTVGATGGGLPVSQAAAATITATQTPVFVGSAQGGTSTPFSIIPPTILVTTYIKL